MLSKTKPEGNGLALPTRHNLIIWLSTSYNQRCNPEAQSRPIYGYKDRNFLVIKG